MAAGGDAVHAFLVERIGNHALARHAVTGLGQQTLDAADRVKAKALAMGAAKNLIDLGLQRHVDGVFRLFDDRIEDDEAAAWL